MHAPSLSIWLSAAVLAVASAGPAASEATPEATLEAMPGSDWPQFRGPGRNGVSTETDLLATWPAAGPRELWRVKLGDGYSGVSVVGDRLFTMYATDGAGADGVDGGQGEAVKGTEYAASFDAATGKELWRTALSERYDTEFGNGPRSTPTVAGDTVYVLSAQGDFAALKVDDGSVRWKLNLNESFGSKTPHWGYATSALVDGEQVVIQSGGPEDKSYSGLDRQTGRVLWSIGKGNGYNSPLAVNLHGQHRYIYIAGGKLTCIDTQGKEVWSHEWPKGETHATPVFVPPDRVYASGSDGVGAHLLKVSDDAGTAKVEAVWTTNDMRNHFSQATIHDGFVYGFDNATLKCMALEDAKLQWRQRGLGKGSLVLADGRLYVLSDKGRLVMVEATGEGYVEKGSVQALEGRCWTPPSLSRGRLYLRNQTEMVAYDVRG